MQMGYNVMCFGDEWLSLDTTSLLLLPLSVFLVRR
jgi:hypothetical protein